MTMTTETTTTDQLRRMVESIRDDLRAMDAGDWPADMDQDDYEEDDPFSAWLNDQLEIVTIRRNDDVSAGEVLVTYGGPTICVTFDFNNSRAEIVGSWGSDEIIRAVYVETLAEGLYDLLNA